MPTTTPPSVTTNASIWGGIMSWISTLVGSASTLTGIMCLISHLSAGTLFTAGPCEPGQVCQAGFLTCLALFGVGTATISPGMNKLKLGLFARPTAQQTGPAGDKR